MRLCEPRKTLARRQDSDLPFLREDRIGGQALLLDTCVYIDLMQGRTPDLLDALIATRQANHSSVAAQELMHTVGVLDPNDDRSPTVIDPIRTIVLSMPTHRTFVPDADVVGRAALLSGIICRLQSQPAIASSALLDCVLFLQGHLVSDLMSGGEPDQFSVRPFCWQHYPCYSTISNCFQSSAATNKASRPPSRKR
jgi:hypothetical protein